jgi:diguanylate cyclase (GGDEF)-like protein
MTSFRLKLVVYFLLLSLLPLAAAFSGFAAVAKRSETRLVDARLQAGLRAALAAYEERLAAADASARALARSASFQRALASRDTLALRRTVRSSANIVVEARNGFRVGSVPPLAAERRVEVVGPRGSLGTAIAWVPLGSSFLQQLRTRSGLKSSDAIVLLRRGRIVAGPPGIHGHVATPAGVMRTVSVGGVRYRALVAGGLRESPASAFAVLGLQSKIDAASNAVEHRLLLALVALLGLVAVVAYFEGRTIVRTVAELSAAARGIARGRLDERVRVRGRDELAVLGRSFNDMAAELEARLEELEAERGRLREAFSRFGEALAATHDPNQLRRVIVETAVEATRAAGGMLVGPSGEVAHVGSREPSHEVLEFPLTAGRTSFGSLTLFGKEFDEEERMTAAMLASHAVVALDNERLHRIVERQALVDGLTGLANRRHGQEVLAVEVARAERFGGPVGFVLADLDGFKDVNDRHGHPTGDIALREFADVLRETVRDVDLVCRWGGEEFMLVLPGTNAAGAEQLAERMRARLRERVLVGPDGTPLFVTASFGVASYPEASSPEELLAHADQALYEAKRNGKDRVERVSKVARHSHIR